MDLSALVGKKKEITIEDIFGSMYETDNIMLKTHIRNPLAITQGRVIAKWAEHNGCEDTAELWNLFIDTHLEAMVSDGRKGRIEFVEACKLIEQSSMMTTKEKLLGRGNKP